MYSVDLSQRVQKFLEKLDKHISDRIKERLKRLEKIPIPSDAKFIYRDNNDKIFRYRIGSYRVLYKIKDKTVLIAKIDKRPRIFSRRFKI